MEKEAKIYVAGHRGLVGSAILNNLKQKGYTNFALRTHQELDLCNQAAVAAFFEQEKPDYVILAAAHVGGIIANNTYRADFIYKNLEIQNNVIHQSFVHGVKKLLFLGSTCIYPKNAPQPMKEDCMLTSELEQTNEPYALAKIAGLKMCESFNLQYGTNYIAVMPTNLYGPNDNFNLERSHVLPALIRKAHLGKCLLADDWNSIRTDFSRYPVEGVSGADTNEAILDKLAKYGITTANGNVSVEIWGTGTPLREFLWSEDMADACVFLMENIDFYDLKNYAPHSHNYHINIGTGLELTIKELAQLVAKATGFGGNIVFNADKPDGTPRKLTDPSKLHNLGWHHKVGLEEGVQRLYQWYLQK